MRLRHLERILWSIPLLLACSLATAGSAERCRIVRGLTEAPEMRPRTLGWLSLLLAASLSTAAAADHCTMIRYPDIQVAMHGLIPMASFKIDGVDEPLVLDSGAAQSTLSLQVAERLNLQHYTANFYMVGATGARTVPQVAIAKSFTFANRQFQSVDFLVTPALFGAGAAGLLGENVLRLADVEYDFANGIMRLIQPIDCGDRPLAYWATSQAPSVVDLQRPSALHPDLVGPVLIDNTPMRAIFDTGGQHSVISLRAAKLVGVTPQSPGVTPAGTISGIAGRPIQVWSAPFRGVVIGGEGIMNTRVLIGDIDDYQAEMIVGADFFLAHRVYVDNTRHKLYFTYNGGPVFNLNTPPAGSHTTGSPASSPPPPSPAAQSDQPTDGAGLMRRAMAYASRNELQPALADLTHAAQLDPHNPDYLYQRGLLYWRNHQPQLALEDFNAALALDPKDLQAHLARAQLELPHLHAGVEDDLDTVDRLSPPDADLRRTLGDLYHDIGQYAAGVHQYDLWIDHHGDDLRVQEALTTRCGLQAAGNIDLDRALADCDKALQMPPDSDHGIVLTNRSLVYLRRGRFDRAIADDTAAIALWPKSPCPLYLRGLAELHKGLKSRGDADLAAAQKLEPDIGRHYASMGLTP